MEGTYAEALSRFAARLSYEDIPPHVVASAKQRVLDILGLCLATYQMEFAQPVLSMARAMGGHAESAVIGTRDMLPMSLAALVNGANAHGLDYDDTHTVSVTHASSCVVPTALAVAERQGATGKELITAAVAGWEAITRIGAVTPGRFNARGFHATSVCGTFATALVAGKLLGLSPQAQANALGISGSFTSGVMEFLTDGSWVKRVHPGWAAHSGIAAAMLAQEGYTGPSTIFEGKYGLFQTHIPGEEHALDRLSEGLGEVWETPNICFKPYPACHLTHAFLDCTLELRRRYDLRAEEVEKVLCRVAAPIVPTVCEPWEIKLAPRNDYDAKFSLPFSVATMLLEGEVNIASYSPEKIADPRILELARKVEYQIDPQAPYPRSFPGWVEVYTTDGRKLEYKLDVNRGSPGFPMSQDEIEEKFRANAGLALPPERAGAIVDAVSRLDELDDLSQLTGLCRP